jgi:hypothetical protein
VTDTNRAGGSTSLDTLTVDHLFIRSQLGSAVPAAPANLTAAAASSNQIDLTWTDNAGNELGFHVERSEDGATWAEIDSVAAGVAAYSDTGLAAETTYYYRVRAYNGSGQSAPSNVAASTTLPLPANATLHVAALQGHSMWADASRWQASVLITVHDGGDLPIASATVSGTWSDGASGSNSCVTDTDGRCSIGQDNIKGNVVGVTFTISDIAREGYDYDPAANVATSLTISQPQ